MNKKIYLIFALAVIGFLAIGTASAGVFDIFGEDEVQNQTYDFDVFTLDIPEDAVVVNSSEEDNGLVVDSYVVTLDNGDSYIIETLSGAIVESMDEYKLNAGTMGGKYKEDYGNWSIFDLENAKIPDDQDTELYPYMLAQHDGKHIYQLEGMDLDSLKSLADTFKAKN